MRALREQRHLSLLLAMVFLLATHSIAHLPAGALLYDVVFTGVGCLVFFIVFEDARQRFLSLLAAAPIFASTWAAYAFSGRAQTASILTNHVSVALFLGFAVVVIVRRIFEREVIRTDDVIGVLCGYLLAGAAWGNLYVLTEMLLPGSFSVHEDIAWKIADRHSRRLAFNYYSFVTLTTLGYGDITPIRPVACWLACLEAVFGQFYLAVVVAQLVGLKLVRSVDKKDPR
jgi:hypothetical protein